MPLVTTTLMLVLGTLFTACIFWPQLRSWVVEFTAGVLTLAFGVARATAHMLKRSITVIRKVGRKAIAETYAYVREKQDFYKGTQDYSWEDVPIDVHAKVKADGKYEYEYNSPPGNG